MNGAPRRDIERWDATARVLHWSIALLVLVQIGLGWTASAWELSPSKLHLFVWHKSLGVLVLALMALRIGWRASHCPPRWPADMPARERVAARLTHAALYLLLVLLPLTGWIVNSAAGVPFSIFWRVPLPLIVAPDEALAGDVARVHLGLSLALVALLGLHVGAALRHHFVRHDDVLARMLPLRRRAPPLLAAIPAAAILLAGALAAPPGLAAEWTAARSGSRIEFVATFEGNPAPGVFREFDTQVRFDAEHPEQGRLDVTVQTASADMRSGDINKAIAGPEWFDTGRFPRAEFHSVAIVRSGSGRYLARGTLKLKGVERAVDVPFTWAASASEARMDGELVVRRAAFDIGTGRWAATDVIGADVTIRFSVRLHPAG